MYSKLLSLKGFTSYNQRSLALTGSCFVEFEAEIFNNSKNLWRFLNSIFQKEWIDGNTVHPRDFTTLS